MPAPWQGAFVVRVPTQDEPLPQPTPGADGVQTMDNGSIAMMLFGVAAAIGLPLEMRRRSMLRRARTAVATGEVVAVDTEPSTAWADGSIGPSTFHARIAFTTRDGRTVECFDPRGVSWRQPTVGASVAVAYDPGNPSNAMPVDADGKGLELAVGIGGAIAGAAMFVAGYVSLG